MTQTVTAAKHKPPLETAAASGAMPCQRFATKVAQFYSSVTLSKTDAIPLNLSLMLLQHLILFAATSGSSYD